MDHTPAIGDRYVLPSGRHVRIQHIGNGNAVCVYVDDAGRALLEGEDDRAEVFAVRFLCRLVRVQCLPAEV